MTVVLRLQGLDVKAGTEDIRSFFKKLRIPEGGVYIIGGMLGEAFIAFSTQQDAKHAMRHNGKVLKGSKVRLKISSMQEMEQKLRALLDKKKSSPTRVTVNRPQPALGCLQSLNAELSHLENSSPITTTSVHDPRSAKPLQPLHPSTSNPQTSKEIDSGTAFLLGICTVLHGLQSSKVIENDDLVLEDALPQICNTDDSNELRKLTVSPTPGYVRLFGLPPSVTKDEICHFFGELQVEEVIVNVDLGVKRGCLVMFSNEQEACSALLYNLRLLGSSCVEVRGGTEKMWTSALQNCENEDACDGRETQSISEVANHKKESVAVQIKRHCANGTSPKSHKRLKPDVNTTALSPNMEFNIMISNLPKTITKTDIKELLGCPNMKHRNVLHLLDKNRNRTDTAFVTFHNIKDYDYALNLTGCHLGSNVIEISAISKKRMRDMMVEYRLRSPESDLTVKDRKRRTSPVETPENTPSVNVDSGAQTCLFARNMPAGVKKCKIKRLFCKHKLEDDDITLLFDSKGNSIGEAVIRFNSQEHASQAQRFHGQDFLGSKLLLTAINARQMENILARDN